MHQVRVQKAALLETLKKNRADHKGIFDDAVEGYRRQAIEMLEKQIERIRQGKVVEVFVRLPMPANHTKDYDRVIRMLEMSLDDEIHLSEEDFQQYVMDDWSWKRQFLSSSAVYSLRAAELARAYGGDAEEPSRGYPRAEDEAPF